MEISELIGKTLTNIEVNNGKDEIIFTDSSGQRYMMYHAQDCCENVTIEDVCGDWNDLIGSPIVMAEELTNDDGENPYKTQVDEEIKKEIVVSNKEEEDEDDEYESCTWTFYRLATVKGYVTLRWFGSSNGYYSEGVDFEKIDDTGEPIYEEDDEYTPEESNKTIRARIFLN